MIGCPLFWRPRLKKQRHRFSFDLSVGLAEAAAMKAARLWDGSGGTGREALLARELVATCSQEIEELAEGRSGR